MDMCKDNKKMGLFLMENNKKYKAYDEIIKFCNNELGKPYTKEDKNYLVTLKIYKAKAYAKKKEYDKAESIYLEEIKNNNINNIDDNYKIKFYINLGDLYLEIKKYDEAEYYYNKGNELNSIYKHFALSKLGTINYLNREYDNALTNFEKALEEIKGIKGIKENTDNQNIIRIYQSSLAQIYQAKMDYLNAIKYYEKAIKLIVNDANYKNLISSHNASILECYVKIKEYEKAINYLRLDDQEYIFNYLRISELFNIRKNLIEAKKYEDNIKEEIDKLIISKKLKSLSYEIDENYDNEIFQLAKTVEDILISYLFNNNVKLIHYTKKELAYKLFCKKEKNSLRLNNSVYMNDPNEGELLKNMLICLDNNEDNKIKNIVDEIYKDKYVDNVRKIIPKEDGIYLTSFSKAIDRLPMWISYTGNASGIGLVLDNNFFKLESSIGVNKEELNYDEEELNYDEEKLNYDEEKLDEIVYLIDIQYIDKNNLQGELKDEKNILLKQHLEEINKLLITIKENGKLNENIKVIKGLLDSIRFIFKDIQYNYEEEVRIIQIENNYNNIKYDENIGRYYINLKRDLDDCNEVILGVKCENKMNLAEYIYNNSRNKNINVTISSAEYN